MKKLFRSRRILSVCLVLTLTLASPLGVWADNDNVEASPENQETLLTDPAQDQDSLNQNNQQNNQEDNQDIPDRDSDVENPDEDVDTPDESLTDSSEETPDELTEDLDEDEPEEDDLNSGSALYGNCAYGKAYSSEEYIKKDSLDSIHSTSHADERYGLQMYYLGEDTNKDPRLLAPSDSDKAFIYETNSVEIHIEAPENYYISMVLRATRKLGETSTSIHRDVSLEREDGEFGRYVKKYKAKVSLDKIGEDKVCNGLVIQLREIPSSLTSEGTIVTGASLVNYKNYTKYLGNKFLFNGGDGTESNKCFFEQVYQGLAESDSSEGFKLKGDDTAKLFPDYQEYSSNLQAYDYITDYVPNADVVFYKDNAGYWTMDSNISRYEYSQSENRVMPVDGKKQFRPFGDDNHFGMSLPIVFSVNSDGKSSGKDTIFKFSGDDDVFVYIDDVLVLDLGGIHHALKGQINFTTGDILIQGDYDNMLTSSIDGGVYKVKGIGNQNVYTTLGTNLEEFSKNEHTLKVFYFERGGNLSNCKISYNFNKDELVTVRYEGLKVDRDKKPLAGATFKLYTDAECTEVAKVGNQELSAVSDENGTIEFGELSAGVLTSTTREATKTYYLKETEAPEGYKLPEDARWQLVVTARPEGESSSVLTALTDEAASLSLDSYENVVANDSTQVKSIINDAKPGKLQIVKILKTLYKPYGDATFVFKVEYKYGDVVFSNVYDYNFTKAGKKDDVVLEIPAGVEVTVEEVYKGASYSLDGPAKRKVTILPDKTSEVKFVNDYDGRKNIGTIGITNVFERAVSQAIDVFENITYVFKGSL